MEAPMQETESPLPGPPLVIARGARVAEGWLLAQLRARAEEARRDPALLARPLRVVVPSRSLREHLAATIVRELGSVLGVQVQTLHGLACEVLERTGADTGTGDALYPVLVRRAAAREASLHEALGSLEDGYSSVLGGVSDFLDAGLEPSLVPALAQRVGALAGVAASEDEALRALALVSVAGRVRDELSSRKLGRRSDRLAGAARALRHAGASVLPARAVWVHGFADATGVALDLIETLCRELGAVVLLDRPPDPAQQGDGSASERFTRRLAERAAGARAGAPNEIPHATPAPTLCLLEAAGADAEVRGVAVRVRALLDGGPPCAPERIGIVARQLEPYAIPLRRHLRRLGIPLSASTSGPGGALGRRLDALVELLRRGAAATVDRWLDAASLAPGLRADLRVALHLVGAGRLGDVAGLDVAALLGDATFLRIEVPKGLGGGDDADGRGDDADGRRDEANGSDGTAEPSAAAAPRGPYTRRRSLSRSRLEWAVAEARQLVAHLAPRADAAVGAHVAWLRDEIAPQLGLAAPPAPVAPGSAAAAGAVLERVLAELERELPSDEPFEADEWVRLLEGRLADESAEALGGAGAGVQLLDVTAARARTFEHLFVLGLNRDVFPRSVPADPLLPDSVRSAVRDVLPDLPVKESGYDEERHLFAQLLSASSRVTLSWQAAGDDGKPRSPSPLVERLRWGHAAPEPEGLPSLYGALAAQGAGAGAPLRTPRPAHEHAVLAALHGEGDAFAKTWPVAVWEAAIDGAPELAATQLAVLRELDRYGALGEPLGPYFGFVGPVSDPRDLRRRDLYVTSAEGIARCGWRHFVERLLGVAPSPDALGALAGVDRALVGQAVHRAVEQIALAAGAARGELADVLTGAGVAPQWPDDAGLAALALAVSDAVLREELRFSLPALARAMATEVESSLRLVRSDDRGSDRRLLGVELRGTCVLPGENGERALHFRADRAERQGDELVLTDVKTGSRIVDRVVKKEETRDLHHLGALRRGTHLQATAYALAAERLSGRPARGRYLFVRPKDEEPAEYVARSDDARFAEAFARTVRVVLAARDAGSFLPRFVDAGGDEPELCQWCDVAEACLRGDSGLRGRLRRWSLARAEGARPEDLPAERALRDLWWLAEERGE